MATPRQQATIDDIMAALERIGSPPVVPLQRSDVERLVAIEGKIDQLILDGAEAKKVNDRFTKLEQRGLGWLAGIAVAGGVIGAGAKSFWVLLWGSGQ